MRKFSCIIRIVFAFILNFVGFAADAIMCLILKNLIMTLESDLLIGVCSILIFIYLVYAIFNLIINLTRRTQAIYDKYRSLEKANENNS